MDKSNGALKHLQNEGPEKQNATARVDSTALPCAAPLPPTSAPITVLPAPIITTANRRAGGHRRKRRSGAGADCGSGYPRTWTPSIDAEEVDQREGSSADFVFQMEIDGRARDSALLTFKVDYEQAKELAIGVAIHSEAFSAGGHKWRVNFYPRGKSESNNNGEYTSIFFELLHAPMTPEVNAIWVNAIFDAFLIDKVGKPCSMALRANVVSFGGQEWGWSHFLSVAHLEEHHMVHGSIWLVCGVLVVADSSIPVPPSDIGKHLAILLDTAAGTDVSFTIAGEVFQAHRAVLAARSPVFQAELLGSMAEATMSTIPLQGISPATFRLMLQYIYTDALPEDDELGDLEMRVKTLSLLLAAVDRYALDRLKLLCAKRLWDNLPLKSVSKTLAWADMHNCLELKNKCLDFMVAPENTRVFLSMGHAELIVRYPHLIAELDQKMMAGYHPNGH